MQRQRSPQLLVSDSARLPEAAVGRLDDAAWLSHQAAAAAAGDSPAASELNPPTVMMPTSPLAEPTAGGELSRQHVLASTLPHLFYRAAAAALAPSGDISAGSSSDRYSSSGPVAAVLATAPLGVSSPGSAGSGSFLSGSGHIHSSAQVSPTSSKVGHNTAGPGHDSVWPVSVKDSQQVQQQQQPLDITVAPVPPLETSSLEWAAGSSDNLPPTASYRPLEWANRG